MCSTTDVIALCATGLHRARPGMAVAVSFQDGVASRVHTAHASALPALSAVAIFQHARKPWTCDPTVRPMPRTLRRARGPPGVSHQGAE